MAMIIAANVPKILIALCALVLARRRFGRFEICAVFGLVALFLSISQLLFELTDHAAFAAGSSNQSLWFSATVLLYLVFVDKLSRGREVSD